MTNKINDLLTTCAFWRMLALLLIPAQLIASEALDSPQGDRPFASYPDIHDQRVVFTAKDDLWLYELDGASPARRLTQTRCLERFAKFSPNGAWVAHNLECDGQARVALTNLKTGRTQVIDSLPALPNGPMRDGPGYRVAAWNDGGRSLLVIRYDQATRSGRVLSISIDDGAVEKPSAARVGSLDVSPTGDHWLITPQSRDFRHRRGYQGGGAGEVFAFDPRSGDRINRSHWLGSDRDPVWLLAGQFFVSERSGWLNLYQIEAGKPIARTSYANKDVRWASGDGGQRIVFEVDGSLALYDADSHAVTELKPALTSSPKKPIDVNVSIQHVALASDGRSVAASVRGDIVVRVDDSWKHLTSGSENDVMPTWDRQDRSVTYLSRGAHSDQIRSVDVSTGSSSVLAEGFIDEFSRSPNGQLTAYLDPIGQLFLHGPSLSPAQPIADISAISQMAWLNDASLLLLTRNNKLKQLNITNNSSKLSSIELPKNTVSAMSVDGQTGDIWVMSDLGDAELPWLTPVREVAQLAGEAPWHTRNQMKPATIGAFAAFGSRLFYLLRDNSASVRHALWAWDRDSDTHRAIVTDLNAFAFSTDGSSLLVRTGTQWRVGRFDSFGSVRFRPIEMPTDLKHKHSRSAEWQQMLSESWRRYLFAHRIENTSEHAWRGVLSRYSALITKAQSRSEAMVILARMLGESGSSHAWIEPAGPGRSSDMEDQVLGSPMTWPADVKYVYLPDTDRSGYALFQRSLSDDKERSVSDFRGLVMDLRGSRGGAASEQILSALAEWAGYQGLQITRDVVMLVDDQTSSDAEILAAMAQSSGIRVVGERTWGGGLALVGSHRLVDGSRLYVPVLPYDRSALRLTIEGQGVIPNSLIEAAALGDPDDSYQKRVLCLLRRAAPH